MSNTIQELLSMPLETRHEKYSSEDIKTLIIDGNVFQNYGAYSFAWEREYKTSPKRATDGTIQNLDSYVTTVTPHLKINYSLLTIDDFRRLYNLLLLKNEHEVTCYDLLFDKRITENMYFKDEGKLPTLWTATERLYSNGEWESTVDVLGVKDYTVELVGTNTTARTHTILVVPNYPDGTTAYSGYTIDYIAHGEEKILNLDTGWIPIPDDYVFAKFCTDPDTSKGTVFLPDTKYTIYGDYKLYCIWEKSGK